MRKHLFWVFLLTGSLLYGQKKEKADTTHFSPELRVGTSFTYIWDVEDHYLREYTWATNVAISPVRRVYVGLNLMNVWAETRTNKNGKYFVGGVFGQYHLGRLDRATIYGETGVYLGNYCTCGEGDAYRQNGLVYVPIGGGLNAKLYKNLWLDVGLLSYNIMNKVEGKYSFTQYIIGLDIVFGKN